MRGKKRLSRTTTKTLLLITDHQFAWSTYPAAPWCVHRMRHLLLARFSLQSLRTWLVFNAAGRAWTPLRFSDVIVDLVFIWCIAFSILGYLFHVDLKKECCVLVILKCCLQHCGHSVYRWRMKPHNFFCCLGLQICDSEDVKLKYKLEITSEEDVSCDISL